MWTASSRLAELAEDAVGYPAEAFSAAEISSFLTRVYPGIEIRPHVSNERVDISATDLLVIGGPKHNELARRVMGALELPWSMAEHTITDEEGNDYCAKANEEGAFIETTR